MDHPVYCSSFSCTCGYSSVRPSKLLWSISSHSMICIIRTSKTFAITIYVIYHIGAVRANKIEVKMHILLGKTTIILQF